MGLDAKDIQASIQGVLRLFVASCSRFVKKYPAVSGILLFFFLLYMFLPSVFTFLIYSLPVLIFIAVSFRLIFKIHRENLRSAKGEKDYGISSEKPSFVGDDPIADKRNKSSIQKSLSVRRRNVKEKDKQVYVQEGLQEKDKVISTISDDALVDKTALIEGNPKEIRVVNVDLVTDRAESSSAASQLLRPECRDGCERRTNKSDSGGGELEAESSEDTEDEDGEETQEDGNKAVEWTDADQKNLTDLGNSEMERNKRLESLIAKRRARKLLSMQVRKTLMNLGNNEPRSQIASISIPKSNPFPPNSCGEAQVSPTPLSAPSVLLPMHDPFDLPYEPQEEKPNLTGGSFQEEFLSPHQKDMMFCRHESFSLGAFFPGPGEFDQCRRGSYCRSSPTSQRPPEIPAYCRHQSGMENNSQLIQTESFQEGKPMLHINSSHDHARQEGQASEQVFNLVDMQHEEYRNEVRMERNLVSDVTDVTDGSSSSSSSEFNVPFSTANKDAILKSLSFSVRKNIAVGRENNAQRNELSHECSPSSFGKKRPEERFFYADKGMHHTPTHSIASDMQVEVSEVSSPALTVDVTTSPSDGESLTYDGDGEVDMEEATCGHEETWVASSNLSRVEENESKSREVHEVSEQDIMEVGFSRINQKSEDPIESCMLPEKVVEQDPIDSIVLSSKNELPESSQTHSADFISKIHDKVQQASTSYSAEGLSTENIASSTQQSTEKSYNSNSLKPEEQPSYSPENDNMNDQIFFTNDDIDILEFIQKTYGEAPILIKKDAPGDISVPTMNNGTKSVEIMEGNYGDRENDHLKSTSKGEFQKKIENGHVEDVSNLIGNTEVQDREAEQGVIDIGSSGDNQNSDDLVASIMQSEIVAELGPTNSSSSSSPTSMTEEKVLITQVPLLNFYQTTQIKAQQFGEEMAYTNFLHKPVSESSTPAASLDGLHLIDGSVAYPSSDTDPEKPWEACIPFEKSTRELNTSYNVNDPEVSMHHGMRSLNIIKESNIEETISKPIVSNEGQYEQQGEHQTLEPYKPLEEPDNPESSEDFQPEIEKLTKSIDMATPSRPIEKTDTWESSQDRECEQVVIDVGVSGVSPLVVEQVPTALCSSSSPKSETQEMVSVSKPIEKMDTWELSQDRECEQVVIDVRVSGVSQSLSDPIPSAMLPELVVEQVPIALSSSSSPKSESQKMVLVDPASLYIDSEMRLKVQKSDEDMLENKSLDKVLPENLTPTGPQNTAHLSLDSTTYPSRDEDLEGLQELNSSNIVKGSEVPTNDGKKNLKTIDDTNSEAHILVKEENAVAFSRMLSKESISKSTDTEYIEGQPGKMGEHQIILESYKPVEKNDNLKIFEDFEGESLKPADCNNIAETSNPVGNSDILEPTKVCEQELVEVGISEVSPSTDGAIGTAENVRSGLNQSFFNDPNPPTVLPVVVEQVSVASSSSSSPTSVLQKRSIDHASTSSFDHEILMEVQQSETEMEDTNILTGLPPENLAATAPQYALHLMEDSTAHPSNSRDPENLQEASNSLGKSPEEDSVDCNIDSSASNEKQEN